MSSDAALRLGVSVVLFVNAFLVFVLQPYISKRLLPVLGGSAEVWTVCALFFQLALLGGYAAAFLARRLSVAVSLGLHAALVGLVWMSWPPTLHGGPPEFVWPPFWTLRWLSAQVGALIVALTATSPLLMAAYARVARDRDPYPLFAASNAGSLAGLLAYPFAIEPFLTLDGQARAWSVSAAVLVALLAAVGIGLASRPAAAAPAPASVAPRLRQRLRWLVFSLLPSVLLLSATAQITTDIAPVPLLWIVPLALYLGSFIRVFAAGWQPSRWTWPAVAVCALPVVLGFAFEPSHWWWIPLHLTLVWSAALLCHGTLVAERPAPDRLAEFYLWLAAGGALGGLLTGVAAPLVFTMRTEYPLAVLAVVWLAPHTPVGSAPVRFSRPLVLGLAVIAVLAGLGVARSMTTPPAPQHLVVLVTVVAAVLAWHRPRVFAVCITAALAAVALERRMALGSSVIRGRSFYGVYSVRTLPVMQARALFHGTTLHGLQSLRPERRTAALAYYGARSPVASVFRDGVGPDARIALVGLGAGAILRYATPAERWTVYEIDPGIARLALNPALFSHWVDAPAPPTLVIGDGRLRLAEAPDGAYDAILLDAFASDAIPVHLLTREAMGMYMRKLRPGGVVVFNVSNRYIDMPPLLAATAATLHLVTFSASDSTEDLDEGLLPSTWVLVGGPATRPPPSAHWTVVTPESGDRAWTDDFSNVLAVLRPVRAVRELLGVAIGY